MQKFAAFLRDKNKILFFILVVFLASGLVSGNQAQTLSPSEILFNVNKDREIRGLSDLDLNPQLSLAAYAKAQDMISMNYFAHESPDGKTPWQWIKSLGYNYEFAGENLAIGFTDPEDLQESWMSSPTHRANILSPNYSEMGLAIVTHQNINVIVQFFANPYQTKVGFK
jgi:uncharacterized protein YkwD